MRYNIFMKALPQYVTDFLQTFKKHNYQIYVVGGSVRDLILEKEVKNWDFTTSAKPEDIITLFPDSFYNNQFGTVGIPLDIEGETMVFEVTTFRKESDYTNTRHPDSVEWTDNVEDDLARRDFTINAMAFDGKKLVDPYNGQEDLKSHIIKAVGNADTRFNEDALRLMRAVRFTAQLGFLIEPDTREAINRNAGLIIRISWERIREELFKILASDHPAEGILFLKNTTLLRYILPELDACFDIPQKSPKRHHIYDVGTHSIMALRHCPSANVITRLATLLHDIGKVKTFRKNSRTGLITFYNHEVVGARQAEEIGKRLKLSNKDREKLVTLVAKHQFTVSEILTDNAVRRFIREVGLDNLQDMMDLRTGDRVGSGSTPTSWRLELFKKRIEELQHEPFAIKDLKIDGHDVMKELNMKPGPQLGEVLKKIFAEVEEGRLKNEREELLSYVKTTF